MGSVLEEDSAPIPIPLRFRVRCPRFHRGEMGRRRRSCEPEFGPAPVVPGSMSSGWGQESGSEGGKSGGGRELKRAPLEGISLTGGMN